MNRYWLRSGVCVAAFILGCGGTGGGGDKTGLDASTAGHGGDGGGQMTAQTIGKAGGKIELDDGLVIDIPAGALDEETMIEVTRRAASTVEGPDGAEAIGSAYACTCRSPAGVSGRVFELERDITLGKPIGAWLANSCQLSCSSASDGGLDVDADTAPGSESTCVDYPVSGAEGALPDTNAGTIVYSVALAHDRVYWTTNNARIHSALAADLTDHKVIEGTTGTVALGSNGNAIFYVYYDSVGTTYRVMKVGSNGTPTEVATTGGAASAVVADGTYVAWQYSSAGSSYAARVSVNGGSPENVPALGTQWLLQGGYVYGITLGASVTKTGCQSSPMRTLINRYQLAANLPISEFDPVVNGCDLITLADSVALPVTEERLRYGATDASKLYFTSFTGRLYEVALGTSTAVMRYDATDLIPPQSNNEGLGGPVTTVGDYVVWYDLQKNSGRIIAKAGASGSVAPFPLPFPVYALTSDGTHIYSSNYRQVCRTSVSP